VNVIDSSAWIAYFKDEPNAEIGLKLQLPLADSIIYATARKFDALLWTQDVDFKNLPGVKYFS
jgi:predicted nucleic acid-binding protein